MLHTQERIKHYCFEYACTLAAIEGGQGSLQCTSDGKGLGSRQALPCCLLALLPHLQQCPNIAREQLCDLGLKRVCEGPHQVCCCSPPRVAVTTLTATHKRRSPK